MVEPLHERRCAPLPAGTPPLTKEAIDALLEELDGWTHDAAASEIRKSFSFPDYHRTMAFVNAVAWIAITEGHHPDMTFSYGYCVVSYTTHAIGGLSDNDFICAAKVDRLAADSADG